MYRFRKYEPIPCPPGLHSLSGYAMRRGEERKRGINWHASKWAPTGKEKKIVPLTAEQTGVYLEPDNKDISAILRVLLIGTHDTKSPFHKLRGMKDLIKIIWNMLCDLWSHHIQTKGVFASIVSHVKFPPSQDININMMPFIMGNENSIPVEYRHYQPLIDECPLDTSEWGKVGYLTIHESRVSGGTSQRRGGLHTETPGVAMNLEGQGEWKVRTGSQPLTLMWGAGYADTSSQFGLFIGGIYMASNVSGSCRVWNASITNPGEVVGHLGDLEHLRSRLGPGVTLDEGNLCWMTDTTPHESLPLPENTYRQYFRLVTNQVSLWYAEHSTPNRLGVVPPDSVVIVHGNKFVAPYVVPRPEAFSSNEQDAKEPTTSAATPTFTATPALTTPLQAAQPSPKKENSARKDKPAKKKSPLSLDKLMSQSHA